MLQRIYGTAFATRKELAHHLELLEEAKRRDHRRLGRELGLFSIEEEAGPGMVIYHPKGALLRSLIENFERREHLKRGYQMVMGPQMLKADLWKRSGHWDNYRDNMYFTEVEGQMYGIKPMNCLAHMLIYKSQIRSYRDLPLRYFELGTVLRHERSGVLHGLTRVRQFTQDDAHILCMPEQVESEILGVLDFVAEVMAIFGFEYEVELSTRPEKSIGTDDEWELATNALVGALKTWGLPYDICAGEGAFYGPKIDIKLKDALQPALAVRHHPVRFHPAGALRSHLHRPGRGTPPPGDAAPGDPGLPGALHGGPDRALSPGPSRSGWPRSRRSSCPSPTGSMPTPRRWPGPCWMQDLRVEVDTRQETLRYKIREAQGQKIPYMVIIGDREAADRTLAPRLRDGTELKGIPLEAFIQRLQEESRTPSPANAS